MTIRKAIRRLLLAALAAAGLLLAWFAWFVVTPLTLPRAPFEFTVKTGASLKSLAHQLSDERLFSEPYSFWILGRLLGKASAIQAGIYRLEGRITPTELLDKLARGEVVALELAFVEGTTLKQWLAQLKANTHLKQTLAGKTPAEIAAALGIEGGSAEGWLFPDTYRFVPGSSDVEILKRAHGTMKKRLAEAWEARDAQLPLASPYEALVLASIVEKETGLAAERPLIASVFVNRLRIGMRLQTDPTVIYGMGDAFDGNIRRKDLTTDTPWNTYTRDGLPPTPIAMPGAASLAAAVKPATSSFLYFVSKGDGSHQFSRSLEEHNRAVAKYQLGKS